MTPSLCCSVGLSKADFCCQQGEAKLFRAAINQPGTRRTRHDWDPADSADPFSTGLPLRNCSTGILDLLKSARLRAAFIQELLWLRYFLFIWKKTKPKNKTKNLTILATCLGGNSKEQNALQNSDVQWSVLLFYKEVRIVRGYISCKILNHYIFPRGWSFLFILVHALLFWDYFSDLRKPWDSSLSTSSPSSSRASTMHTACADGTAVKQWGLPTCSPASGPAGINPVGKNCLSRAHSCISAPPCEPLPNGDSNLEERAFWSNFQAQIRKLKMNVSISCSVWQWEKRACVSA